MVLLLLLRGFELRHVTVEFILGPAASRLERGADNGITFFSAIHDCSSGDLGPETGLLRLLNYFFVNFAGAAVGAGASAVGLGGAGCVFVGSCACAPLGTWTQKILIVKTKSQNLRSRIVFSRSVNESRDTVSS